MLDNYTLYLLRKYRKFNPFVRLLRDGTPLIFVSERKVTKILALLLHFENYHTAIDVTASDQLSEKWRFQKLVVLLNSTQNTRLIVASPADDTIWLSSASNLYRNAAWMEREVSDLMGLKFKAHTGMNRLLQDYGATGAPLQKLEPSTGMTDWSGYGLELYKPLK